jgi:O-acetyl-ADP-ribose deacetylase (regulator of RNase III)
MFDEDSLLASCYHQSLCLAKDCSMKSIAFPSISTGAYGFPLARAAGIAIKEVVMFFHSYEIDIWLVCFDDETNEVYLKILTEFQSREGVNFQC